MIKNTITIWRGRHRKGGITKAHLARQIGVSRSYVTRLEQGKVQPGAELMLKIARYFGCHVEEVFTLVLENGDGN